MKQKVPQDLQSFHRLYHEAQLWLEEDWRRVKNTLDGRETDFRGKRILVTGAAGFLGFNFLNFFSHLNAKVFKASPIAIVAADNYLRGKPRWMLELANVDQHVTPRRFDITQPWADCNS